MKETILAQRCTIAVLIHGNKGHVVKKLQIAILC